MPPAKANTQKQKRNACKSRCQNGAVCNRPVYVLESGEHLTTCYFHASSADHPEISKKRHRAAVKGGSHTRRTTTLEVDKSSVRSASDVSRILATTLEALGRDSLDPRQATAISTVANTMMRSIELELEETRLAELEARLGIGDGRVSTAIDEDTAGPWIQQ